MFFFCRFALANWNSVLIKLPLPPAPGNHCSIFCLYECDSSRYLILSGIIQHLSFYIHLILSRFIHIVACVGISFFFLAAPGLNRSTQNFFILVAACKLLAVAHGSSSPTNRDRTPGPLPWDPGVLATGPLGKSLHFFLRQWYSLGCIYHVLLIHSSSDNIWLVLTFWLLWIMMLWTLVYKYLSPYLQLFCVYIQKWNC